MSRLNYQNKMQGHRVGVPSNRDLEQKLTYQQLLNLNHDLTKENQQLKNIGNRLGQQLKQLHSQFDIKPRNQNVDLYEAIGKHPILHHYQLTLIPLLDAYQQKIQNFEGGFQTINEQFINLQKKYEQVIKDNEKLRGILNDKNSELIQVYKSSQSDKLGADFNQIILQQINQKQKFLTEQNARLQKQYSKYKSQSDKNMKELTEIKKKYEETSNKYKNIQLNHRQLQNQLASLKQSSFNLQMKNNQLDSQKKKIQNDLDRAVQQNNLINKDFDGILKSYENLKNRYQKDINSQAYSQYNQSSYGTGFNQNGLKTTFEVVQHLNDDSHKKLAKLQKQYDVLLKQKNKYKQLQEQYKLSLDQNNSKISQLKKKIDLIDNQRNESQLNNIKNKKLLQQFTQKSKNDIQRLKRQYQQNIQRQQESYQMKLQAKQKKINQIEQQLDRIRLQKDKFQQENIIYTSLSKQNKGGKNKDNDRMVQKLKQKLQINSELFKEQLQIIQNDNTFLKNQNENLKQDNKDRNQEIKRLKLELQKLKKEIIQVQQQKQIIIDQIKRVRNEYELNLKDKQKLFDQKIRQIKLVVQQADKKRKAQRLQVSQASRQYKRVLEEIKNTYEDRIRVLQSQSAVHTITKVKKVQY